MTETSQILLAHHLKALKLPTFLREYDKVARLCAAEGVDHPRYLMRLAEMEMIDRERRMVDRRIKVAKLPTVKCLDSFDFLALPSLNEMLVLELARVPRDRPADRLGLGLHAKCRRPPDARLLMGALLVEATSLALAKVPELMAGMRTACSQRPSTSTRGSRSRCVAAG